MTPVDILVVENDPDLLRILKDALEGEDVQVRTATDMAGGLEAIRDRSPDALFVSLELEPGNAGELIRKAREKQNRHLTPVVLLTGGTGDELLEDLPESCVRLEKNKPEALYRDIRLLLRHTMPLKTTSPPPSPGVEGIEAEDRPRPFPHRVFDGLEEGTVEVDAKLRIQYANPSAMRCLDVNSGGLFNRPLDELFSPSSRKELREVVAEAAVQGPEEARPLITLGGRTLGVRLLSAPDRKEGEKHGWFLAIHEAPAGPEAPKDPTRKELELSLLNDILSRARSSLPEEAIFPFLLKKSIEFLGAEAGTVALLELEDGDQGHLAFRYAQGERAESVRGIYIPKGQGIIGWCVSNDEPVIVNDVGDDQRFFPWVDQMSGFRTRSLLCIPIHSEGEVLGALEIVNKRHGDFTQNDIELLRTLVDAATFNMKTALVQQRLVNQRDYYSGIMDSLSEGVMVLRRDHTITDVNQYFVMFLNRERSDIIGNQCYAVLKERSAPCEDCFLDRLRIFEEGKDCSTLVDLPALEGETSRFRVTGTPLEIRDEIIDSAILTFHDVTRIHRLNEYLHASASVASLLLKGQDIRGLVGETLEIMGRAAGASRCYWYENRKDERSEMLMVLQAEWCAPGTDPLRGKDNAQRRPYESGFSRWLKVFSEGQIIDGKAAQFPKEEREALESKNVRTVLMIPLFAGETFQGFIGFDNCETDHPWQEAEINLLQTTANLLSKAFEHERSLKALRDSEARYRDIYENIYDSWYLHDMDGRFLEVNPAVERAAGYAEEELLQMNIRDLIPSKYQHQFERYLRDIREKGVAEGLIRIRTKSGEERIMEYRNWVVQRGDGHSASRGLVRDVTERMNLKSQLKHAQRMESIGTIATGISHNFRNLLAGVMTNCQLIHMKYRHIPELERYSAEILKLTHAGSDLIKNLLQFARKGSTESKSVINLSDVLQETHNIISRSFDKRITIQTHWPDLLPVYGDSSSLSQVFMNLCTNARDAMPNGGTLSITAERKEREIVVGIQDTGAGMDKSTQEKAYDPFFTTKEPGRGTGLGLSTAYGIVKQHGGRIQMESEPAQGTSFHIVLPVPDGATRGEEVSPTKLVQGKGEKVLVVDDDETILQPMIELLEALGYQASAVSNGPQAIESYMSWGPDVVLLDRSMPGMDGLETAGRILSLDSEAWIILISGYDEDGPDGIDLRIRDSIRGYIPKPFDIGEVSKVLAEVLNP